MPGEINKVLILGSSGQVGGHLVKFCEEKGVAVFEYDLARNVKEDLREFSPGLIQLIKEVDFVFFLAFDVGGSRYLEKYQQTYEFIDNNMRIMINTFDALKETKKPFIFASSQMSNMTHSPYGVLKLLGENLTKTLGGLTVHFWNVYGFERDENKSHVVTDFITMALKSGEIIMRTNGTEERDFLYANDACRALLILACEFERVSKEEKLHIARFKWTNIREVAEVIASKTNSKVTPSLNVDSIQNSTRNEPDKNILKYWEPEIELQDGIDIMIEIIESNSRA